MLELFKASSIHIRHFSENFGIFTHSLIFNSAQTAMGGPLLSLSLISLSLLIRRKSLCWVKVFWVLSVPASFLSLLSFQFPTNPLTYWLESLSLEQTDLGFSTPAILACLKQLRHSSDDEIPTFEVPSFTCAQFADIGFILVSMPSFKPVCTS